MNTPQPVLPCNKGKEKKTFVCSNCGDVFLTKKTLGKHIEQVHEGKQYQCSICPDIFSSENKLMQHIKFDHEKQELYGCPNCDKKFRSENSLRRHDEQFHQKITTTLICPHCAATFSRAGNLNAHIRYAHEKIRYDCHLCDESYTFKRPLKLHIERVHEGKSNSKKCPICKRLVVNVKRHVDQVHEKITPHICDICSAKFPQKHKLEMHVRTVHQGERPYECQFCDSKYTTKQNLDNHIQKAHGGKKTKMPSHVSKYKPHV